MNAQETLRASEAAEILKVQETTLANWRSSGRGPTYARVGRRILYRLSDVRDFIEANKVIPENR